MDAQDAIRFLNEINELDPDVLPALINHRIPCNEKLAAHPTVQVGETDTGYEVGLLGIINGLFGVDANGWGHIYANFVEASGRIRNFSGRNG